MSKWPTKCQLLNSDRKSFNSFITEEREAFKVESQVCQLLFGRKSLLIKTNFLEYFGNVILIYMDLPTVH